MLVELKRISASNGGRVMYSSSNPLMSARCIEILKAIGIDVVGAPEVRARASRQSDDDVPECDEKYIRRAWRAKLLSRDDEEEAFREMAEAEASERMILSEFLFAPDMYIGVLDRIASRRERFDHVVGGKYSGKRAEYMKMLPSLMERVSMARDRLAEAYRSGYGVDEAVKSLSQCLDDMSLRNYVVERLCDDAYEQVYVPYMRARRIGDSDAIEKAESSFGMDSGRFVSEFSRLMRAVGDGCNARSRVIEANQRLVVFVAKKHMGRGMPFVDLVQEGNVGLVNAVRKFSYGMGHKFSTYAIWWIRQAISRAIENKSRTIRIPVHVIGQIDMMKKERSRLLGDIGREASDEEVASALRTRVPSMADVTEERVAELRRVSQGTVSIDCRIGDDDATYAEFVSDVDVDRQVDAVDCGSLASVMADAMASLDKREKSVISARYGLADGVQRTLDDVGLMFDVTRERIRQIETSALMKLKGGRFSSALAEFLAR